MRRISNSLIVGTTSCSNAFYILGRHQGQLLSGSSSRGKYLLLSTAFVPVDPAVGIGRIMLVEKLEEEQKAASRRSCVSQPLSSNTIQHNHTNMI